MEGEDRLLSSLRDVRELETFLHELLGGDQEGELGEGGDIAAYAKQRGVRMPDFLAGEEVTLDTRHEFGREFAGQNELVLVRPGHPDVLGLTIKCVRWRGVKICLECGWLWCKIVIKGRF